MRYLAAGGHGDIFDIDAHLQGVLALDRYEHDTLAYALNERLDELVAFDYVPYLSTHLDKGESLQDVISELLTDGRDPTTPDVGRDEDA